MSDQAAGESTAVRPLRVLVVDYSVGFGGATKSMGLVASSLGDVDLSVLTTQLPSEYLRWYAGLPVRRFRRLINYHTLELARSSLSSERSWPALRKLLASVSFVADSWSALRLWWWMRRAPVDLIHLNNGFVPPDVLWAARRAGLPCVVHLRGFPNLDVVREWSGDVAAVVCVSRALAQDMERGGFAADRTHVIWDPVDFAAFDRTADAREGVRARLGIAADEIAVGLFGRIVRWKGTVEFVQACAVAMRRHPRIRPVIVGGVSDGAPKYLEEVRMAVGSSGYPDRFIFAGYQPAPEPYYHAMDIVVHASIEPEPFGMVVPEAMAAGKPVIAAAAGGPLDVIVPGADGLLTPPGDAQALADAISALAADPAMRTRLGERAKVKVRGELDVGRAARRLREVWRRASAGNADSTLTRGDAASH